MAKRKPELKPCPFPACGSEDTDIFATHDPKGMDQNMWLHAKCKECGASGPRRKTTEAAAEDWNRRSP